MLDVNYFDWASSSIAQDPVFGTDFDVYRKPPLLVLRLHVASDDSVFPVDVFVIQFKI